SLRTARPARAGSLQRARSECESARPQRRPRPDQRRDPASLDALPHLSDRSGRAAVSAPSSTIPHAVDETTRGSVLEVFAVALRLGVTSFGGPIAHLGYFRTEYVQRRA